MRLLTVSIIGIVFLPASALASEPGTYRAGSAYLSMSAQSPDQCISYCTGDAQCKGWNFVTVNQSGSICEFNSRLATPIASPISISANTASSINHSRLIPAGQRTVRVGQTPSQARRIAASVKRVGQVPRHTQNAQATSRNVVRMPLPQSNPRQQIANYRSPVHSISTPRSASQMPRQAMIPAAVQPNRGLTPQLDVLPASVPRTNVAVSRAAEQRRFQPMLDTRPQQQRQTYLPDQNELSAPERPQYKPPTIRAEDIASIPTLSQMPSNKPRPSIESGLAGGPVAATLPPSSSLYGSLYDDVKAPRSLNLSDIPQDLDAPIPTVKSVPVEALDVQTF